MKQKREVITAITKEQFIYCTKFVVGYVIVCLILGGTMKLIEGHKIVQAEGINTKSVSSQVAEKKALEKKNIVKKGTPQVDNSKPIIYLYKGDEEQNRVLKYLWDKTKNVDMILTFYGESWLKKNTINNNVRINAKGEKYIDSTDFFYCQVNSDYHATFISEVKEDKRTDTEILDYCIEIYNKAIKAGRIHTTFYAYDHRYEKRIRSAFYINQKVFDISWGK